MRKLLIALICCASSGAAQQGSFPGPALSEREAMMLALERSREIRVLRLRDKSDSLAGEQVRAGWLPRGSVSLAPYYTPWDSSTGAGTRSLVGAKTEVALQQVLPGGAGLGASLGNGVDRDLDRDSSVHSLAWNLTARQPLLKDAGRYAPQDFAVRLRRLDAARFTQEQKERWLTRLSTVRLGYWNLQTAMYLVRVAIADTTYAHRVMQSARARLLVGQGTELDTLSAKLEVLQASQRLLSAMNDAELARREMAIVLQLPQDSLHMDTAQEIPLEPAPRLADLVAQVREFDPELRLLKILGERFRLERDELRNARLPYLELNASLDRARSGPDWPGRSGSFAGDATIGFLLRYEFPNRFNRLEQKQTELELQGNDLETAERLDRLEFQAEELLLRWNKDLSVVNLAEAAREVSRRQLEAALQGYAAGVTNQLTMLKAQNDFVQAESNLIRNRIQLKTVEVLVEELSGAVLGRFGISLE